MGNKGTDFCTDMAVHIVYAFPRRRVHLVE